MDFSVVNLSYDYSEELGEVCLGHGELDLTARIVLATARAVSYLTQD